MFIAMKIFLYNHKHFYKFRPFITNNEHFKEQEQIKKTRTNNKN